MAAATRSEEPRLDLIVAGHTNIDHLLGAEALPERDRTVPLRTLRSELGGTAATIARVAARSGVRTGLLSRVGTDFPDEFVAMLRRDGVDLAGLERVPGTRSPACFIAEDGRGHQIAFMHPGPMGDLRGAEVPEPLLGSARWLHLTTGDPRYQLALKRTARRHGVRIAVDPAQEIHYRWSAPLVEELLQGAEMLFGNESEIRKIQTLLGEARPADLLDRIPVVIMTRGARGVRAWTRVGDEVVPAPRLRGPHSVTGAGDAFRGGFYGAFFRGQPLAEALRAGTRSAVGWIRPGVPSGSSAPTARPFRAGSRARP
ncbi:MAG: carbohydrate kinase family protein [Thermoplasmata archaeon]